MKFIYTVSIFSIACASFIQAAEKSRNATPSKQRINRPNSSELANWLFLQREEAEKVGHNAQKNSKSAWPQPVVLNQN